MAEVKRDMIRPRKICFYSGTAGNWGGASRVLFTTLSMIDLTRFAPIVLLTGHGPGEAELDRLGITCKTWGPLTEYSGLYDYFRTLLSASGPLYEPYFPKAAEENSTKQRPRHASILHGAIAQ